MTVAELLIAITKIAAGNPDATVWVESEVDNTEFEEVTRVGMDNPDELTIYFEGSFRGDSG